MKKFLVTCLGIVFVVFGIASIGLPAETQLTFATDVHHALDNNLNFSPDGQWLAYDTRAFSGGITNTNTLEKVNVATKEIVVIHEVVDPVVGVGPGTAAVSYFPDEDKVIAIHGFQPPLQYQGTRRFGAIFSPTDGTADMVVADARDVTEPLTPGALRGGSHRHEPTGDGQWIGFTYNDLIMASPPNSTDLRTIGVTKLGIPVSVDNPGPEDQDGIGFTVLVVKVIPKSTIVPGSNDIYQGSDDAWVGAFGYDIGGGTMQRARAFIGRTVDPTGDRNEVYIVDIPEDITVPGPDGPLEGTATTFPMPPAGTVQRRLTYSDSNVGSIIRSSKDGSRIAFEETADGGTRQIFYVSPLGGAPVQATSIPGGTYKPWWHPSGDYLISIADNSIWGTNVIEGDPDFGHSWRITHPSPGASPDAIVFSNDGSLIGFNRELARPEDGVKVRQIFVAAFFVPEPSTCVLAVFGLLGLLAIRRSR
ncbi:MAG: hypothetical protein A2W31_02955 [Planctomycetes bacterium RBG_16_64_10]|nr:MAG: hypothetical protein A2W31_02955 [Planctomycetes bacterium RBG_16_64_10]